MLQNHFKSRLDIDKESIAYLRLRLGVMVVSDTSLVSCLVSNAGMASELKTYEAYWE